jgi:hypothetical protein
MLSPAFMEWIGSATPGVHRLLLDRLQAQDLSGFAHASTSMIKAGLNELSSSPYPQGFEIKRVRPRQKSKGKCVCPEIQ